MKTTVADLMTPDVETLNADEDLVLAGALMRMHRVRHLPVVRGERLVGLVTHRDLLRAQAKLLTDVPGDGEDRVVSLAAADLMTADVQTVTPETPAAEAAAMLLTQKIGCLPVTREGELVGIVTEHDFLRWSLKQLRDE